MFLDACSSACAQPHECLVAVINPPLQPSESTDHDDPCAEAVPEEPAPALLLDHVPEGLALVLLLAHLGHKVVSRLADYRAEHARYLARSERDRELGALALLALGLGEHVLLEKLHTGLEADELHDGLGNLPCPQGLEASEGELLLDLVLVHFGQCSSEFHREGPVRAGLHADLDHLHRTECDVCEELRSSTSTGPHEATLAD